jgi:hypothetical protein
MDLLYFVELVVFDIDYIVTHLHGGYMSTILLSILVSYSCA